MPPRPAVLRFAAMQLTLAAAVAAGLWLSFPAWRLGQVTPALQLPMWMVYTAIPLSGALTLAYAVLVVLED